MLKFLYKTVIGRMILKLLINPKVSAVAGSFLDSKASAVLIKPFINKNNIDITEYEADDFRCFNDCFTRKIKPGKRTIDENSASLISPCDGLLSVYDITDSGAVIPIKQSRYTIGELLGDEALAAGFAGGKCLVFRLCVNNYHRYCYFDSGIKGKNCHIDGELHTVRPIALSQYPVFVRNSREYTLMHTDHFGAAIQVEVGAMLVGRIVNLHEDYSFSRGEEKGYFMYGGSTIVLLLTKDSAIIDENIVNGTCMQREYGVKMGQRIGYSNIV